MQNIIRFWSIYQMILNGLLLFINSCVVWVSAHPSDYLSAYFHHWDVKGARTVEFCRRKWFSISCLNLKSVLTVYAFCVDVFILVVRVRIKFSFAASVTIRAFHLFIIGWFKETIGNCFIEMYSSISFGLKWFWKESFWCKNSAPKTITIIYRQYDSSSCATCLKQISNEL